MIIAALPSPPSTGDPTTFAVKADALIAALPQLVTEINLATDTVNANVASILGSSAGASATQWVSGSYNLGQVAWSPITYQTYRAKTTGSKPTDPSLDTTNWAVITGANFYISTADPATVASPYQLWADATAGLLKIRNAADTAWITVGALADLGIQSGVQTYAAGGGTANAITATFAPAITALTNGMVVRVRATGANSSATPTFSPNGIAAKTIAKDEGVPLAPGDIAGVGHVLLLLWDTTFDKWLLLNPANGTPIGAILYSATGAALDGTVKANGAALSRTTYASLYALLVTAPGFTGQTFTCTIATPAVFTKATHGFTGGERLRLTTTGALPTGLALVTDYFVEIIDANTFYLSASLGGARINTSGTQSGVHTYTRSYWGLGDGTTTFNVPDLRGEFARGLDDGRGVDVNRAMGSWQADDFRAHTHASGAGNSMASGASLMRDTTVGTIQTGSTGGNETRPRNISLLACIKY